MGRGDHPTGSVLVGAGPADPDPVLATDGEFWTFIRHFSTRTGIVPYALDEVRGITVSEFCERYVSESHPDPPTTVLRDEQYDEAGTPRPRADFATQHHPMVFVLGCARSGTTLLRTMLNGHEAMWAPGELHLALFDTMAQRARDLPALLRRAFVPEVATRLGITSEAFAARLAGWERSDLATTDVYRVLHEADPDARIVDKTPGYSGRLQDLDWIKRHFDDSRFVHIVRNPHDVVRSFVRMQLYKDGIRDGDPRLCAHHVAEIEWFRHNANIAAFLRGVDPDRSIVVRYEDLVADPEAELRRVCAMLQLDYRPTMADPYAQATGPVSTGAGDPTVNRFSRVERRPEGTSVHPLGGRCARLAETYGYAQRDDGEPAARPGDPGGFSDG